MDITTHNTPLPTATSTVIGLTDIGHLARWLAAVRWTLLSCPRQKRSPPEGSTYPSTVTKGQLDWTLNISPT